jgi:hypothetical protein
VQDWPVLAARARTLRLKFLFAVIWPSTSRAKSPSDHARDDGPGQRPETQVPLPPSEIVLGDDPRRLGVGHAASYVSVTVSHCQASKRNGAVPLFGLRNRLGVPTRPNLEPTTGKRFDSVQLSNTSRSAYSSSSSSIGFGKIRPRSGCSPELYPDMNMTLMFESSSASRSTS